MVLRSESPHIGGKKMGVAICFSRESGQSLSKYSFRDVTCARCDLIYNGADWISLC
jgi:hypothetical protein